MVLACTKGISTRMHWFISKYFLFLFLLLCSFLIFGLLCWFCYHVKHFIPMWPSFFNCLNLSLFHHSWNIFQSWKLHIYLHLHAWLLEYHLAPVHCDIPCSHWPRKTLRPPWKSCMLPELGKNTSETPRNIFSVIEFRAKFYSKCNAIQWK